MKEILIRACLTMTALSAVFTWAVVARHQFASSAERLQTFVVLFGVILAMAIVGFVIPLLLFMLHFNVSRKNAQRRQHQLDINSKLTLEWDLDAGLAGDEQARKRYKQNRQINQTLVPIWTRIEIDRHIDAWRKKATQRFNHFKSSAGNIDDAEKWVRKIIYWVESEPTKLAWLARDKATTLKAHQAELKRLEKTASIRQTSVSNTNRIAEEKERHAIEMSSLELCETLIPIAFHGLLVQDFFTVHPCAFSEADCHDIDRATRHDSWCLLEIPLVRRVLLAEAELANIFERYVATTGERAKAVRRLAKGAITECSIRRVDEELAAARLETSRAKLVQASVQPPLAKPVSKPVAPPPTVTVDRHTAIKRFVRNLTHLTREEQNIVMRYALKLDNEELLSITTTMAELKQYSGDDQHDYIARRYHELSAKPSYKAQVDEVTMLRPAVKPQFARPESIADVLARLNASSQVDPNDVMRLQKLLKENSISEEQAIAAVKHIICYRLAHGSTNRRTGKHYPYRIDLNKVAPRFSPCGSEEIGRKVVEQMVRTGELGHRNSASKLPAPSDPVKLSPQLLHKYRGIT